MKYINYTALKERYTIPELCDLYGMEKSDLKAASKAYNIEPERASDGVAYFNRFQVRRLHNELYKAERIQETKEDDVWG